MPQCNIFVPFSPSKAHLLLTGLAFVVALAAAVAVELLPEVSGAAVESVSVGTPPLGSSEPAALLRSVADVERRAAKWKNSHHCWRT